MCRMIAVHATSHEALHGALSGFPAQSGDSRVRPAPEAHPDGWGWVAAGEAGPVEVARSTRPLASDPRFGGALARLQVGAGPFHLVHARQASCGPVRAENTHPFVREGWAFMHNGTIEDDWSDVAPSCRGDTDSERLFLRILARHGEAGSMAEAIRLTIGGLAASRFTSARVIATNGRRLVGYRRVGLLADEGRAPEAAHYGMFLAEKAGATVVAQEPTHLGRLEKWEEIGVDDGFEWTPPGSLVRLSARSPASRSRPRSP